MKTIYKYNAYGPMDRWIKVKTAPGRLVNVEQENLTDVAEQAFTLWVETEQPDQTETWEYLTVGTGHPYPADAEQVHTIKDREFIWHLVRRLVQR